MKDTCAPNGIDLPSGLALGMVEHIGGSAPRPQPKGMLKSRLLQECSNAPTQLVRTGLRNPI
eukprot:8309969-Alexandrium_andersonii.AAC.1